jgi:D-proline reductase (dithiol) PrdB
VELGIRHFPFEKRGEPPWSPMPLPLARANIALITSAGLYPPDSTPFDMRALSGDWSIRLLPSELSANDMLLSPVRFDRSQVDRDKNVVYPVDRLRELIAEGAVAEMPKHHIGMMGYVLNTRALLQETVPEILAHLRRQYVDAVVLVPACIFCHQTLGLVAREVEAAGIPTVMLANLERPVRSVKPPRVVLSDAACGHTLGPASSPRFQRERLHLALRQLEEMREPGSILRVEGIETVAAHCVHIW